MTNHLDGKSLTEVLESLPQVAETLKEATKKLAEAGHDRASRDLGSFQGVLEQYKELMETKLAGYKPLVEAALTKEGEELHNEVQKYLKKRVTL